MRRRNGKIAVALGAGLVGLASACAACAADVSLDDVLVKQDKPDHKLVLKHVDVKGSSLSPDDVRKLLSGELSDADETALAKTLKADSLTITELDATNPESATAIKNIVATGVDSGKIAKLDIAGGDIVAKDGGGHIGALHAETLNLAPLMDVAEKKTHFGGLGLTLLNFEGLDVKFPLEDSPGLAHLVVAPVALTASYDGDFPVKSEFTMKGLTVEMPAGGKEAAQLKAFGIDKVQVDFHTLATCVKATKSCNVADFTINLPNLMALTVTGNLANMPTGLDTSDKEAAMAALMQQQIGDLQVKLVNSGLYDKAMAFYAASKHVNPSVLKAGLPAMTMMVPQLVGDAAAGKKLADALGAFLKQPNSLTVSVKSNGPPVTIMDLVSDPSPAAIFKKLTLDASANK